MDEIRYLDLRGFESYRISFVYPKRE